MSWMFLGAAGLLEVLFTLMIRYTDGFTRPWPTLATIGIAALSLYFVVRSTETIPLGTAYAIWGGIGAAGTVLIGIAMFNEALTIVKFLFLALLIGSVVGLKLVAEQ